MSLAKLSSNDVHQPKVDVYTVASSSGVFRWIIVRLEELVCYVENRARGTNYRTEILY